MNQLTDIFSNSVSSNSNKKTLSQAFKLVGLSNIPAAIGAFLGHTLHIGMIGSIVALLASLGVMFAIYSNKNNAKAIPLLFLFTALSGLGVGGYLGAVAMAGHGSLIMITLLATTVLFYGLSTYAANTAKDFSNLGGFLFVGLIAMIILSIANMFLHLPILHIGLAGAGVVLFSLFVIYDVNTAMRGGESNYIILALNLWLNFFNLFLSILRLVLAFNSDE